MLEEEKNHELTTQREKELADIADKQLKEEEERKRRQTQMQLDLEAAERMAEDDLEDMMDDTPDYTSVEQDNINASGSEVFESEHHSDFVKQDNEGVAVISDAPAKNVIKKETQICVSFFVLNQILINLKSLAKVCNFFFYSFNSCFFVVNDISDTFCDNFHFRFLHTPCCDCRSTDS